MKETKGLKFAQAWMEKFHELMEQANNASRGEREALATVLRAGCAAAIHGKDNEMWEEFGTGFVGLEEGEAFLHLANEVSPTAYQKLIWNHDGIERLVREKAFGKIGE